MTISRKALLAAAAGGSVLLVLQACGGGGGGDDDDDASCGASGSAIAGNHGHRLSIALADLDSTTNRTYNIRGSADHAHSVTFTPAQLAALKAGQDVNVVSTTNVGHAHNVRASCA